MDELSLPATAREQGRRAAGSGSGRAVTTVYGGLDRSLRQTVGRSGDLLTVPRERHSLEALEDAAVLLTVVGQ